MFLEGKEKDWIPADARDGPLVNIAKSLLKPGFYPSQHDRSSRARYRYFAYSSSKKQRDLPFTSVLDGKSTERKRIRRRIFKARRLPKLCKQATEMRAILEWVNEALLCSALKVQDRNTAFEIFVCGLRKYKMVDGEYLYEGHPLKPAQDLNRVDENNLESNTDNDRINNRGESGNELASPGTGPRSSPSDSARETVSLSEIESSAFQLNTVQRIPSAVVPQVRDEARMGVLRHIFDIAAK